MIVPHNSSALFFVERCSVAIVCLGVDLAQRTGHLGIKRIDADRLLEATGGFFGLVELMVRVAHLYETCGVIRI